MPTNIQASFTVETKLVRNNLVDLARLTGRSSKTSLIQIRVLSSAIEISNKGISKRIEASTDGEADITLPLNLLKDYMKSNTGIYKTLLFRQGELACGSSIFSSTAIIVKPVFFNSENVLPSNLNHLSVLRFWLSKNEAEIEKLGLSVAMEVARRNMKTNILEALEYLKQYDVFYEDLEVLVKKKIKNEPRMLS